jgi:hypothetical protein
VRSICGQAVKRHTARAAPDPVVAGGRLVYPPLTPGLGASHDDGR